MDFSLQLYDKNNIVENSWKCHYHKLFYSLYSHMLDIQVFSDDT
jgi:hypothetical protein